MDSEINSYEIENIMTFKNCAEQFTLDFANVT